MKSLCFSLALITSLVALAPAVLADDSYLIQKLPSGTVDWGNRWVEATGKGFSKNTGNPAQEKLLAQRAATADAYRQLAETVYGVRIDAETVVRDFIVENDLVRTRVDAVVKGAQATGPASIGADGVTQITLRMPLYGKDQLSGAIQLDQHVQQQVSQSPGIDFAQILHDVTQQRGLSLFPQQIASTGFVPLIAAAPVYTGLVLDLCQSPIQPVMSPAVFGQEQQVYIGRFPIDPDQIIAEGVLQYYEDFDRALESQRVGKNPLVIEAIGTNPKQTDVIVSPEDAERIRQADLTGKFLQKLKVVVASTP